jgi:hypothetical protein
LVERMIGGGWVRPRRRQRITQAVGHRGGDAPAQGFVRRRFQQLAHAFANQADRHRRDAGARDQHQNRIDQAGQLRASSRALSRPPG